MLPLREGPPAHPLPLAVAALAAANALGFALALAQGPDAVAWLERWGLVPRLFLRALGGAPEALWLTPLTAMFLHAGALHLAGSLLYLWIFGRPLEQWLGARRFAALYFACGLAAALVHVAAAPSSYVPAIGASGALSGLLGAYAMAHPTGRLRLLPGAPLRVPAFWLLLAWIAVQVAAGVSAWGELGAGVAWWAHVGGFATGAALARSLGVRHPTQEGLRA